MARTGKFSPTLLKEWIDALQAKPCFLTVMSGDPFAVSDPLTLEPSGSTFVRIPVVWARTGNMLRNAANIQWLTLPPGTVVTSIVGMTTAVNGKPLFSAPYPRRDFPSGGYLDIDAGKILVGF